MVKVLVVDDYPVVREGLRAIIAQGSGMTCAAVASDAGEAIHAVRTSSIDVVLLDVLLAEMDGIEVLDQIRRERPELPVLMMGSSSERAYGIRALRSGAVGYFTKDLSTDQILQTIRKAAIGQTFINESLSEQLLRVATETQLPTPEILSDREFQVLRLMGLGMSVSKIAAHESLSVKTVSTYRARILEKLHLKNDCELIRYALKHNLAD